jgi:poly(3-hydroxyoctanoate) depolymerase
MSTVREVRELGDAEARVLAVDGMAIRVRESGTGDPLLLLNGLARPLESWAPFVLALPGRRLVAFDAPGVGGSPTTPLPLSIEALAALALSLLDELEIDSADVLGFSHGGGVAQQLAVLAPARLRRLVLVSTSCGLGATPGNADALKSIRRPPGTESWPRSDSVGTLWNALAFAQWTSIPLLGAISVSTLVVCGAHDRVVPPGNSRLLARRIPRAELAILPAGHDLQRSGPASALADRVEPFLATAGG